MPSVVYKFFSVFDKTMGLRNLTRYVATLAIGFYLLFAHTVLAAAVPIFMITVAIIISPKVKNEDRSTALIEAGTLLVSSSYIVMIVLALVLPKDDQLFGPVTSYIMLMLATSINHATANVNAYVVSLSIFATSVAAFSEDFGPVALVSMSGSAVVATWCIASKDEPNSKIMPLAIVTFYPLLGLILYEWLAVSSDPAPVPLVVGTTVSVILAILS